MEQVETKKAEQVKPRYEFRTFGHEFESVKKKLAELSAIPTESTTGRSSDEIYIVSPSNNVHNIKIRDDKIDIKTLLQATDGVELWKPVFKSVFPVSASCLLNDLLPAMKAGIPRLSKESYNYNDFLTLIGQQPGLKLVNVHKQRFGFNLNNTICETGTVFINGVKLTTIAIESAVIADIKKTIKEIGLSGVENINYPEAIKRVTGMINKPLAN